MILSVIILRAKLMTLLQIESMFGKLIGQMRGYRGERAKVLSQCDCTFSVMLTYRTSQETS
jgi:hypothetical protein